MSFYIRSVWLQLPLPPPSFFGKETNEWITKRILEAFKALKNVILVFLPVGCDNLVLVSWCGLAWLAR